MIDIFKIKSLNDFGDIPHYDKDLIRNAHVANPSYDNRGVFVIAKQGNKCLFLLISGFDFNGEVIGVVALYLKSLGLLETYSFGRECNDVYYLNLQN